MAAAPASSHGIWRRSEASSRIPSAWSCSSGLLSGSLHLRQTPRLGAWLPLLCLSAAATHPLSCVQVRQLQQERLWLQTQVAPEDAPLLCSRCAHDIWCSCGIKSRNGGCMKGHALRCVWLISQ